MAFAADRGAGFDIYVAAVRGGEVTAVTTQPGGEHPGKASTFARQPKDDSPLVPPPTRIGRGTTAFAVGDADGNLIAVTLTLSTWGGTFYVSKGLGFLYNNHLRSTRITAGADGSLLPLMRSSTGTVPTLLFADTPGGLVQGRSCVTATRRSGSSTWRPAQSSAAPSPGARMPRWPPNGREPQLNADGAPVAQARVCGLAPDGIMEGSARSPAAATPCPLQVPPRPPL